MLANAPRLYYNRLEKVIFQELYVLMTDIYFAADDYFFVRSIMQADSHGPAITVTASFAWPKGQKYD
jgi:hypothetical protein